MRATDFAWGQFGRQRLRPQGCASRLEGIEGRAQVSVLFEGLLTANKALKCAALRLSSKLQAEVMEKTGGSCSEETKVR